MRNAYSIARKCQPGIPLLALQLCLAASVSAANWPAWRGPAGTGVASENDLPETWGTNQNVRWRVALPGPGNSSPIAWGKQVFITQAIKAEKRRAVIGFARADGRQLWQAGVLYAEKEPSEENHPYCSATPVTDGQRVVASFGSAGLYCYDLAGKESWHRDLGKMNHPFGNASSPVLYGDLCLFNFGPDPKARLIAVDKRDGHTVWEVEPPRLSPSRPRPRAGAPAGGAAPKTFRRLERGARPCSSRPLNGMSWSWLSRIAWRDTSPGAASSSGSAEALTTGFSPRPSQARESWWR